MSEETREIKIVGVDKEAIKSGSDKTEHWSVPFKLSAAPDQNWQRNFYEVQKKNSTTMKRKLQITGNTMVVEIASGDDLQKVLDVLKLEVAEVNVLCEEDYQKKLKIRQELEILQKKQREDTQKFKDDADKLVF